MNYIDVLLLDHAGDGGWIFLRSVDSRVVCVDDNITYNAYSSCVFQSRIIIFTNFFI